MRHIDVHTIAESIKTSSEENICHFVYNCFESKSFAMWLLETFKLCIAAVRRARRWVELSSRTGTGIRGVDVGVWVSVPLRLLLNALPPVRADTSKTQATK